jgi:hypothetical protein
MKIKKTPTSSVIGCITDPDGYLLADKQGSRVVYTGQVGCYLLTAKKRDTHLLASS